MSQTSEAAKELCQSLQNPVFNRTLRKDVGRGELDYEKYLRTGELLALQTPVEDLSVPDELLFQIQHQTQELWMKCAAFEATNLVTTLDADACFGAVAALDRMVLITRSLGEQMRIMFTLPPSRFHVLRRNLGKGSGLESPGYNQTLTAAEASWAAFQRLLMRRRVTVLGIYRNPDGCPDLFRVLERFADWDTAVQSWLVEHFMVVRRTLGIDKTVPALDGFPTVALGARMTRPLFPDLWNVRVEMSQELLREGGCPYSKERAS